MAEPAAPEGTQAPADEMMPPDEAQMALALGIVDALDAAFTDGLDPNEVEGAKLTLTLADGSTKELEIMPGEAPMAEQAGTPAEQAAA